MNGKKPQAPSAGFAYLETSKNGNKYFKITVDLSQVKQQGDKIKLLGFITDPEQIEKGKAEGKQVPNIRFIESVPQAGKPATTVAPKAANKSTGLPF